MANLTQAENPAASTAVQEILNVDFADHLNTVARALSPSSPPSVDGQTVKSSDPEACRPLIIDGNQFYIINPAPNASLTFLDIPIVLQRPVRTIILLGNSVAGSCVVYISFSPTGADGSGGTVAFSPTLGVPIFGLIGLQKYSGKDAIRFRNPISRFFISGDAGGGAPANSVLILCTDDIDAYGTLNGGGF